MSQATWTQIAFAAASVGGVVAIGLLGGMAVLPFVAVGAACVAALAVAREKARQPALVFVRTSRRSHR